MTPLDSWRTTQWPNPSIHASITGDRHRVCNWPFRRQKASNGLHFVIWVLFHFSIPSCCFFKLSRQYSYPCADTKHTNYAYIITKIQKPLYMIRTDYWKHVCAYFYEIEDQFTEWIECNRNFIHSSVQRSKRDLLWGSKSDLRQRMPHRVMNIIYIVFYSFNE